MKKRLPTNIETERITLDLPVEMVRRIRVVCAERNEFMNYFAYKAFWNYLSRDDEDEQVDEAGDARRNSMPL